MKPGRFHRVVVAAQIGVVAVYGVDIEAARHGKNSYIVPKAVGPLLRYAPDDLGFRDPWYGTPITIVASATSLTATGSASSPYIL